MEFFKHTVTQEDLDNNPGLEADLKVGDEIEVPVVDAPVNAPAQTSTLPPAEPEAEASA